MHEKGNWMVSTRGKMFRLGKFIESEITILHLDDHDLFSEGINCGCIKPFFPNARVVRFHNGDKAYEYIRSSLQRLVVPDLIITDINHLGMPGHEFVKAVRELEANNGRQKLIPIVVLSFASENHDYLKRPGMACEVLSKCSDISEIVEAMECALFDRVSSDD